MTVQARWVIGNLYVIGGLALGFLGDGDMTTEQQLEALEPDPRADAEVETEQRGSRRRDAGREWRCFRRYGGLEGR